MSMHLTPPGSPALRSGDAARSTPAPDLDAAHGLEGHDDVAARDMECEIALAIDAGDGGPGDAGSGRTGSMGPRDALQGRIGAPRGRRGGRRSA